eukprot:3753203-Prymnesium_polylepis.1
MTRRETAAAAALAAKDAAKDAARAEERLAASRDAPPPAAARPPAAATPANPSRKMDPKQAVRRRRRGWEEGVRACSAWREPTTAARPARRRAIAPRIFFARGFPAARLEALKGKYGTHVASNMKQKLATDSAKPAPSAPQAS